MAVTAATMKKEKRNEPAATTFVNYLESWYQNKCLSNSTSSSTAAYYYWMIFNVIEPSLPDKERAVDDIDVLAGRYQSSPKAIAAAKAG